MVPLAIVLMRPPTDLICHWCWACIMMSEGLLSRKGMRPGHFQISFSQLENLQGCSSVYTDDIDSFHEKRAHLFHEKSN